MTHLCCKLRLVQFTRNLLAFSERKTIFGKELSSQFVQNLLIIGERKFPLNNEDSLDTNKYSGQLRELIDKVYLNINTHYQSYNGYVKGQLEMAVSRGHL